MIMTIRACFGIFISSSTTCSFVITRPHQTALIDEETGTDNRRKTGSLPGFEI
jgi:hypothetical protein